MDYTAVSEKIKTAPIRSTLGYAASAFENLYGRVEKGNSGILKFGLQLGNGFIAQPIVKKSIETVVKVSDPWVDTFDKTLSSTWQTVEVQVIEPGRKFAADPKGVTKEVTCAVRDAASTRIHSAADYTTIELKNRYSALLDVSERSIDSWLPDVEEASEPAVDQNNKEIPVNERTYRVTKKATRRIMKRMEGQFQHVRAFSGGRLKEIIHVDLVAYAEAKIPVCIDEIKTVTVSVSKTCQEKSSVIYSRASAQAKAAREFVYAQYEILSAQITKFRSLYENNAHKVYKVVIDQADAYGVPQILEKAKEMRIAQISDYVLVKLRESQEFVLVERKVFELFRSLFTLLMTKDAQASRAPASSSTPVAADQPVVVEPVLVQ